MFSEKYHTTVGVKIDKKIVEVDETEVNLILWDLAGEDEFQKVRMSYLRGSAGYLLVVDGTRPATLDTALSLRETISEQIGDIPFVMLFNKSDLSTDWGIKQDTIDDLNGRGWLTLPTSAKTGKNVEKAFSELSRMMVRA